MACSQLTAHTRAENHLVVRALTEPTVSDILIAADVEDATGLGSVNNCVLAGGVLESLQLVRLVHPTAANEAQEPRDPRVDTGSLTTPFLHEVACDDWKEFDKARGQHLGEPLGRRESPVAYYLMQEEWTASPPPALRARHTKEQGTSTSDSAARL